MSDTCRLAYVRLTETNLMAVRFYADGTVGFFAGGLAEWRADYLGLAVLADAAAKGGRVAPLFDRLRALAPPELAALVPVTPRQAIRLTGEVRRLEPGTVLTPVGKDTDGTIKALDVLAAEGDYPSVAAGLYRPWGCATADDRAWTGAAGDGNVSNPANWTELTVEEKPETLTEYTARLEAEPPLSDGYCTACGEYHGGHRIGCPAAKG